jgi:predicted CoA-binding protein
MSDNGAMSSLPDIRAFLDRRRFAMVGVSRDPKNFSRSLFREFRQRGYDVVPVNPGVAEVDGVACAARLRDVAPRVDAALLMTNPAATGLVVEECAQAGVDTIWMYRAVGPGAVNPSALLFCKSKGIRVIAGECPFMFLPDTGLPHRIHGFCLKLFGKYPVG